MKPSSQTHTPKGPEPPPPGKSLLPVTHTPAPQTVGSLPCCLDVLLKIVEDNQPCSLTLKKSVTRLGRIRGAWLSSLLPARTPLLQPARYHMVWSGSPLPLPWQGSGITDQLLWRISV